MLESAIPIWHQSRNILNVEFVCIAVTTPDINQEISMWPAPGIPGVFQFNSWLLRSLLTVVCSVVGSDTTNRLILTKSWFAEWTFQKLFWWCESPYDLNAEAESEILSYHTPNSESQTYNGVNVTHLLCPVLDERGWCDHNHLGCDRTTLGQQKHMQTITVRWRRNVDVELSHLNASARFGLWPAKQCSTFCWELRSGTTQAEDGAVCNMTELISFLVPDIQLWCWPDQQQYH